MLKRVNKEQICCPVVFFEEIWGGKYPARPRVSCFRNRSLRKNPQKARVHRFHVETFSVRKTSFLLQIAKTQHKNLGELQCFHFPAKWLLHASISFRFIFETFIVLGKIQIIEPLCLNL